MQCGCNIKPSVSDCDCAQIAYDFCAFVQCDKSVLLILCKIIGVC